MAESSNTPSFPDLVAQIATLTFQVQENTSRFMALNDKNGALRYENYNLLIIDIFLHSRRIWHLLDS